MENRTGQESNNPPMTPAEILQLKIRFKRPITAPEYSSEAWELAVKANPKLIQAQLHILKQLIIIKLIQNKVT